MSLKIKQTTKSIEFALTLLREKLSRSRMLHMKTKTEVAIELLISLQMFAGGSLQQREF